MGKRILALILSLVVLLGVFPANSSALQAEAAEEAKYKIEIVSFAEGKKDDLRSSELLEARLYVSYDNEVTWTATDNYKGTPITQLSYTWSNDIDTYLYLYNSHNMYNINNTAGEVEVGKDSSHTGTGFAWAAIYGAYISSSNLMGTIRVTVKTSGGTVVGSDSHTGSRQKNGRDYIYSGIVTSSLADDIKAISFGVFEGDSKTIIDMLGEAGIVHITCTASSVTQASVDGSKYISIKGTNPYTVTGVNPGSATSGGDAKISISISKQNCKFHQYESTTGTVPVYVYKKPTTTTTATTLTLTNLDPRCTYFIDGVQGTYVKVGNDEDISNDYILFEGLTPNTNYTVMAKGETKDTEPAYAYVYDKTKPSYSGRIKVMLHTNANAAGALTDITDIVPEGRLVFRLDGDLANIATERTEEGVYLASLSQGVFYPWLTLDGGNTYTKSDQQLVVTDANVESTIHFYQVEYEMAGGEATIEDSIHFSGEKVYISAVVPQRAGYTFTGWKDQYGNSYEPQAVLSNQMERPYRLTAQWEDAADVYLNVTIRHKYQDTDGTTGYDQTSGKDEITLHLVYAPDANTPYLETGDDITITNTSHPKHQYTWEPETETSEEEIEVTKYTANVATFTSMPKNALYSVATSKQGYDVESVTSTQNDNGDHIINVVLQYAPDNSNLEFEVKVSGDTPEDLIPQAAIVKVLFWSTDRQAWEIITQQEDKAGVMKPGVRVDIDPATRKGTGSYPVWTYEAEDLPYGYRIVITSLVYPDGSIVYMNNNVLADITKNETDLYQVTIGDVQDGANYGSLKGAYFSAAGQQGILDAVIHTDGYKVTFDAQGGKVNDQDRQTLTAQYKVPSFDGYVPVREGGYVFEGWYKEETCETPAVEGEYLSTDITLYAKWTEPLTVQGTVTISGTYFMDGQYHTIHSVDRAQSVMVALQKFQGEEFINIASQNVEVQYGQENLPDVGIGTYSFTGVQNSGEEYRIQVLSSNYETLYRHEPESNTYSFVQADYNTQDCTAEFDTDKTAVIDAYLVFDPQSFPLQYQVDATAIGEGYRPTATEMLVLYDDGLKGSNPLYWAVISQMVFGSEYHGQNTVLVDGKGNNSYLVWNEKPDGESYYDYAIRLNGYTTGTGKAEHYDSQATPFEVAYNGSARYDAIQGQSQMLEARLSPKSYPVRFDLGFEETDVDNIGDSMEEYHLIDGTYATSHTWSFSTDIEATPDRPGYAFAGWFIDADGDKEKDPDEEFLTQIDAAVHEDITLTAAWTKLAGVYVNMVIEHVAADGVSYNNDAAKHNVEFTITQMGQSAALGGKGITWDGEETFAVPGYSAEIASTEAPKSEQTRYTATAPTVANAIYGVDYTVSVEKSGYSVESINRTKLDNGDTVLDVTLVYDPYNFDFVYTVELDAEAKEMPAAIKPKAVHVKVTSWYDTPYDEDFGLPKDTETMGWYTITQQRDTYSRIELGSDGTGTGTYPVWKTTTGTNPVPYYYRIEIMAYELANGTVVPVKDLAKNQPSIYETYATEGGIYSAVVLASDDCADPDSTDTNLLTGAYCSQEVQVGTIKGIISIKPYDITLDPNGGSFTDTSTAVKVLENQVWMPDISQYIPTRPGYSFDGWEWTKTADKAPVASVPTGKLLSMNLTLTATWTPIQYTVTYVVNGGELPAGTENPKQYTISTKVVHPTPTREDYVFKGWYESQSFAGQAVDGFEPGETGDKVFYAKWEYDLAAMRITKKFAQGTPVDPEQTFIFHIVGEKTGIDLRVHVKGAGSVNINGLPRGSYTVTEETQWSWRYVPKQNQIKVELTSEGAFLVFENQRSDKSDKWINASDLKTNRFQ